MKWEGKIGDFSFPFHSNQVKQDLSFFRRIRDGSCHYKPFYQLERLYGILNNGANNDCGVEASLTHEASYGTKETRTADDIPKS